MVRDWKNFPELRNSEMVMYYFQSPHKQILEDFRANVVKVIDGDTIRVKWAERDFEFRVRFLGTDAPELNERGGLESKAWLEGRLLGQDVDIEIDSANRVGKFGRILGKIRHGGFDVNEESIRMGWAKPFDAKDEGKIIDINKLLKLERWF